MALTLPPAGSFSSFEVFIVSSIVLFLTYVFFSSSGTSKKPLPPGPKPLPLIGNLLDLPKDYDWLHWAKHRDLYGPLSSIRVLGKHIIILNDPTLAFELLDKKSSIYSDRPEFAFCGKMVGWENTLALSGYGERFRWYRRNIHAVLGTKVAVGRFFELEVQEAKRFLRGVLECPGEFVKHIRTEAGAIILKISHGYSIEADGPDPLIELADEALIQFSAAAQPGVWLVDVLPFLRYLPDWLPGTGFKRTANKWNETLRELTEKPHAFVKKRMASGNAFPSYTSMLLEKISDPDEEFLTKWSAASMYSGGADTTVSAIHSFFLAMTLHPDVQSKAQAELDSVVGSDRLPTFSDRPNLPYVEAVVKEVLRWGTVAPMGLPHVATEDDEHMGYHIPKGSLLLANIWFFLHDPKTYHNPHDFNPGRYFAVDGRPGEQDPRGYTFGFGRRICPGKELADTSVWITIALTLATFGVSRVRDQDGKEVIPVHDVLPGVISHPKPFECSIRPRSAKTAALIAEERKEEDAGGESDADLIRKISV